MFSEAQKTAYKSVKAPEELRQRVLEMAKDAPAKRQEPKRPARRWMSGAIAACLMLVATAAVLMPRGGDVSVRVDGAELTEAPVVMSAPMTARAVSMLTVPLTVECDGRAKLSVSAGRLLSEDGSVLTAVEGEATLYWEIEGAETTERYTLTVSGAETTRLTLAFDDADNCWTVFAAKE